ncbi:MAG: transporter substrate-binding domain-containing protein [Muribaculaceae bacterium]|nr:transporter substrate-binding domain-containing protein [Muribaculaceae bacterium]
MLRPSRYNRRNGQAVLYVALLLTVVAGMYALSRCDRPVDAVTDAASGGDTIDVAIEYAPITYYAYDDTLGGYDYDLLRKVSEYAHRAMKFHPIVTLQRGIEGLANGTYDVLVAQYPMTASDRERFLFTEPVYIDKQVLVQRRPAIVRSQFDLAGDTVWVVKSSPMAARIEGLSRELGDTIHVMADHSYGAEQLVMLVAGGEVRYAVVNRALATGMAKKLPQVDVSVDISLSQFQAWVLARDNQVLCDSLNSWLRHVKNDAKAMSELQRRYFAKSD